MEFFALGAHKIRGDKVLVLKVLFICRMGHVQKTKGQSCRSGLINTSIYLLVFYFGIVPCKDYNKVLTFAAKQENIS